MAQPFKLISGILIGFTISKYKTQQKTVDSLTERFLSKVLNPSSKLKLHSGDPNSMATVLSCKHVDISDECKAEPTVTILWISHLKQMWNGKKETYY